MALGGGLLAARAMLGPYALVRSPMNLEGTIALAFLTLLLLRNRDHSAAPHAPDAWPLAVLALAVTAAFFGSLDFPLLADDYAHIWNARHADAAAVWAHFAAPESDRFFRPAVYCSYAFDALWAGISPTAWRAGNLFWHILNVLLVYWLCRVIGIARAGAVLGALLFGLHGSRPEAVTWVAARFDLMAVTFGLACILAVLRGARWWISCPLLALALMSKESAYVVPALLAAILWYRREAILKRIAPLIALEAVALAYRVWLLGGIGGYRDTTTGAAVVFKFSLAQTLNGLFPRFWAAMLFPLNWTGGLSPWASVSLLFALAAMGYLAWRGSDRRKALLGIALAIVCALPVHQFLLIGPDLEKSRVLYFATVGLAVLLGSFIDRLDWKLAACALALVAFQLAALENNLRHWREVGELAGRTCAAGTAKPFDLPNVVDGVYFLHIGYAECLKFNAK